MTTLQAISALAIEIESVYTEVSDFDRSSIEASLHLKVDNEETIIEYLDLGEGEISCVKFSFWRNSGEWRSIWSIGIDKFFLDNSMREMMRYRYRELLEEYEREHEAEIAEVEAEYYKEMYYDNKMCMAIGK